VKAIAGSVGGITEALFLQPMDVVKTRLQLDRVGRYTGVRDCLAKTAEQEGTRALWKGLTPFATHLSLKYMLRMGTNAVYQNALRDEHGDLSGRARLAAGFGAGVTEALVIVTPFEVVKIKLQQQRGMDASQLRYKGPLHCAAAVVREHGPLGLWAGAAPTVLRNGTNQMCMFWAKSGVDGFLWDKRDGDGRVLHPLQSMVSGAVAATLGPFATGPFDVVKTRLMVRPVLLLRCAALCVPCLSERVRTRAAFKTPHVSHVCLRIYLTLCVLRFASCPPRRATGAGAVSGRGAQVPRPGARADAHSSRRRLPGAVEGPAAAPAAHTARPGHHLGGGGPAGGHVRAGVRRPGARSSGTLAQRSQQCVLMQPASSITGRVHRPRRGCQQPALRRRSKRGELQATPGCRLRRSGRS
jgi:solute carrier family 25 citrate transporter 1